MVAAARGLRLRRGGQAAARIRVATRYVERRPGTLRRQGRACRPDQAVRLDGAGARWSGLADAIVNLVSTGGTLKANNLVEVEDIMPISSRLVVNQASLKLKRELIQPVLEAFAGAVKQ